ncbi:MAG: carbohydrate ABC transporter permease [Chloroflexi bacterium]|nr:carbohydrate ABC transporter permease [Chloroflexota bacterium]
MRSQPVAVQQAANGLTRTRRSRTWRRHLLQSGTYLLILVLAVLFGGPFMWALFTSLKTTREIFIFPPTLFPKVFQWHNYIEIWRQIPFALFYRNSIVVTVATLIGQMLSASLVAYGFSRFRFPGRDALFVVMLSTLMLPSQVTIIPQFILFRFLGWLDSYNPLIVPAYFGGGAFAIFLFRQFFLTLPKEFDEAATIDGASSLSIFFRILVPMSKPVFITMAIFSFLGSWNDFFYPLIYLNTLEKFTLQLGLQYYRRSAEAGGGATEHLLMASAMMMTLPSLLLFIFLQQYFVRGVVMSGIKG